MLGDTGSDRIPGTGLRRVNAARRLEPLGWRITSRERTCWNLRAFRAVPGCRGGRSGPGHTQVRSARSPIIWNAFHIIRNDEFALGHPCLLSSSLLSRFSAWLPPQEPPYELEVGMIRTRSGMTVISGAAIGAVISFETAPQALRCR